MLVPGVVIAGLCFSCNSAALHKSSQEGCTLQKSRNVPGPDASQGLRRLGVLIAQAKAADSPEGSRQYARHVTEDFVFGRTGVEYIDAFSSRLSTADLLARRGERKWIPEKVVARAYNYLMAKTGGSSSRSIRTNSKVVHQIRITLSELSPALTTVTSHESDCLPSEAILLMSQLLLRNGSLNDRCPPLRPGSHGCVQTVNAVVLVFTYSRTHSASDCEGLINHVARLFDI